MANSYESLHSKLNQGLYAMQQILHSLNKEEIKKVYFAMFHSHLNYGTILWNQGNIKEIEEIFRKQKSAVRLIKYGNRKPETCRGLFKELKITTVTGIFIMQSVIYAKKYLSQSMEKVHDYNTRKGNKMVVKNNESEIVFNIKRIFNKIPIGITSENLVRMKKCLKKILLNKEYYCMKEFYDDDLSDCGKDF